MTLQIESKNNSVTGTDSYRDTGSTNPRAWQPTASIDVSLNKLGSNANVTVRNDDYVVVMDANGRQIMTDRFIMTTKFTALQEVVAATERERIFDNHVMLLIAAKADILAGRLSDEPLVIDPSIKTWA